MKYRLMHASDTKEVENKDERIAKQIRYLSQGADFPIEVNDVLQEALKFLAEFPAFEPKLLGLQLSNKATKQTVLGLVGSAQYYVGTQMHHLALTVLFSPLADPKRHFQLICSQKFLSFHLIDHTGCVILDTCPYTCLLDTVRWFVSAVQNFLMINASAVAPQSSDRINVGNIWAPTEVYREWCHTASQHYNTLASELAERQRAVIEEINNTRHRGNVLSSIATRLAKDMTIALELISDNGGGSSSHEKTEHVGRSHTAANVAHRVQPDKDYEPNERALETIRILANLSAIDRTILDIIDVPPTQELPMITQTTLRSVRDALSDLTEKALNLRYAIYSLNQDMLSES